VKKTLSTKDVLSVDALFKKLILSLTACAWFERELFPKWPMAFYEKNISMAFCENLVIFLGRS